MRSSVVPRSRVRGKDRRPVCAQASTAGSGQCSSAQVVRSSSASATWTTPSSRDRRDDRLDQALLVPRVERVQRVPAGIERGGTVAPAATYGGVAPGSSVRGGGGERVLRPPAGRALPAAATTASSVERRLRRAGQSPRPVRERRGRVGGVAQ